MSESTKSDEFSFIEAEHQVLNFLEKEDIFKKNFEKTKDGEPYIFYDGPYLQRAYLTMAIWLEVY